MIFLSSDDDSDYDEMGHERGKKRYPTLGDFLGTPAIGVDYDTDWSNEPGRTIIPILLTDAMKETVDKSTLDDETLNTLLDELRVAASNGNADLVAKFVPDLIEINVKFKNNWTLLLAASFGAQESVLKYLLQLPGCNVNETYKSINLLMAVINAEISNLEFLPHNVLEDRIINCLKLLTGAGLAINSADSFGTAPLAFAIKNNQLQVSKFLLSSGAHVNAYDLYGDTALHIACRRGYTSAASLLLKHGADRTIKNTANETPLQCAKKNGHENVIKALRMSVDTLTDTVCGEKNVAEDDISNYKIK